MRTIANPCSRCGERKPELIGNMRKYCDPCDVIVRKEGQCKYRSDHKEELREWYKRYQQTHAAELKKYTIRYHQTAKYREAIKRYQQSEKVKIRNKQYSKQYQQSEKFKKAQKRYWKSEKGKENNRRKYQKRQVKILLIQMLEACNRL